MTEWQESIPWWGYCGAERFAQGHSAELGSRSLHVRSSAAGWDKGPGSLNCRLPESTPLSLCRARGFLIQVLAIGRLSLHKFSCRELGIKCGWSRDV